MTESGSAGRHRDTATGGDFVLPFQIVRTGLHGRLVRLGPSIDQVLTRHDYPEPVARLLGEALTLTCTLASTLKFEGVFTLQAKGDGPIKLLVADVTSGGDIRGYAELQDDDALDAVPESESAPVPTLLGAGYLAFTVDQGPHTDRYQGVVELSGATLADCAHHYFRQSEQMDTILRMGVEDSDDGWRAYGLMVRNSPGEQNDYETPWDVRGADTEQARDDWLRTAALIGTVDDGTALDPSFAPEILLYQLFHEDGVAANPARTFAFQCRCSRERVESTLRMLNREDVEEMKVGDEVVVTCQFCNANYRFGDAELARLYAKPN